MRAIIVHGGAGKWRNVDWKSVRNGIQESVTRGFEKLMETNDPELACVEAIMVLEDNPIFNAGTGSVLTLDGICEMDALIMNGKKLEIGGVAGIKNVKNPIYVAYKVMKETDHVLLVGEGASLFAKIIGIPEFNPVTPERIQQLKKFKTFLEDPSFLSHFPKLKKFINQHPELIEHETVGCVAVNDSGEVVAGTSTGGVLFKLHGRVGDTPIPGAGTYASEKAGSSATGIGEGIIRVLLTKLVSDLITIGIPPMAACKAGIDYLTAKVGKDAGVIALDNEGNFGYSFNTLYMPGAYLNEKLKIPVFFGFPPET